MFTGLITHVGRVVSLTRRGVDATLAIDCTLEHYELGESIAVDGICLSVTSYSSRGFEAQASAETLEKTSLGEREIGAQVHLERALRHSDRMGGHLVTGHVDGVGRIEAISPLGDARRMVVQVPPELAPFIAPKGSITIDGVSLTVNGASGTSFDVVLVPVTQDKTLLANRGVGARVNLEVDVLAKYVARLLNRPGIDGAPPRNPASDESLMQALKKSGYL
jgi:riboflavin synthase